MKSLVKRSSDTENQKQLETTNCVSAAEHIKRCEPYYSFPYELIPAMNIFRMPKVYAESSNSPSATARMENNENKSSFVTNMVSEMEVQDYISKETGKDRLHRMFQKNTYGENSFEYNIIKHTMMQTGLIAFLVSSVFAGKNFKEDFARKHQATVFSSRFQASRRYNDALIVHGLKEGAKWGIRVSMFSGLFVGISQCIAVYRNKSTPFEYAVAAAATGGIFKATLGIKGIIAGCVFGGVTGLIGGTVIWGSLYALDETQEKRHHWHIQQFLAEAKENKGLFSSS